MIESIARWVDNWPVWANVVSIVIIVFIVACAMSVDDKSIASKGGKQCRKY